jgi:hypothetical protein
MAHDVFISHSRVNKTVADALCAGLEAGGIRCWIAPRDVLPGRSFAGEITRAINQSKVMVLIFSADSNNSEQILREVQLAANARLHIIQFRLEDVVLNDDLQYYLSTPHWLDAMTPPLESHLGRLRASIEILLKTDTQEPLKSLTEVPSPVAPSIPGKTDEAPQDTSVALPEVAGLRMPPVPVIPIPPPEGRSDEPVEPPSQGGKKNRGGVYLGVAALVIFLVAVWAYVGSRPRTEVPRGPLETTQLSPTPSTQTTPAVAAIQQLVPSPSAQLRRSSTVQSSGKNPGISFVSMDQIFKSYSKTKDAEAKISEVRNAAKLEYDNRSEVYKKLLDEINQFNQRLEGAGLSAESKSRTAHERDAKIVATKAMEKEINDFRTAREKELQDQTSSMRASLVNEITVAIDQLIGAGDSVVIDTSGMSANGVPLILFSPASADMSSRVVSKLNGGTSSPFSSAQALRLATVDMNTVFKNYTKTKDAESKINEAREAARKEFDDRAATYKKLLEEINQLNRALEASGLSADSKARTARDRDEKIAAVRAMEREINEFRATRERQLQDQSLKMREDIVSDIKKAISATLPSGNSPVIIDQSGLSADGVPLVPYCKALPDLSRLVTDSLNRSPSRGYGNDKPSFSSSEKLRFACVDMNRILNALPGANEKPAGQNEKEMTEAAVKKRSAMVEKIVQFLSGYAPPAGVGVIFDSSGHSLNTTPVIVASPELPDLTDDVIKGISAP